MYSTKGNKEGNWTERLNTSYSIFISPFHNNFYFLFIFFNLKLPFLFAKIGNEKKI